MSGDLFQSRINKLDVTLFDTIPSETSEADRASLLALQQAVRTKVKEYVYLEIGSHLGGTIQPHLLDPCCSNIYSIDKRPYQVPDERGAFAYPHNSTERMIAMLRQLAPDQVHKIECFDTDAQGVDASAIKKAPHLCFIDGEHTNRAVCSDFRFCVSVCARSALIAFHDGSVIYKGISNLLGELRKHNVRFTSLRLSGEVYVIALSDSDVLDSPGLKRLRRYGGLFTYRTRSFYMKRMPGPLKQLLRPIARHF